MRRLCLVLLLAGWLAACSSSTQGSTAPTTSSVISRRTSPPVVEGWTRNRERTRSAVAALLDRALVPPGAVPLASAPPQLRVSATRGVAQSLVEEARYWRVRMSLASALGWLHRHPPPHLRSSGHGSGSRYGVQDEGYDAYAGPTSDAWTNAELDVEAVRVTPHESALRADGRAFWIDPRPSRDVQGGRRVRITIAGGCPRSDAGVVDVRNVGSDLDRALVPAGTPTAGLVCDYRGLNGTRFTLLTARRIDAARAKRLARAARAVPLGHADIGTHGCPADDLSAAVIILAYRGRSDVDLWYHHAGCSGISNGHIGASTASGDFEAAAHAVAVGK